MTSIWGPLGWMTLHSVSLNYPIAPTIRDKTIAMRFLTLFADTITCKYCKDHFDRMFAIYTRNYPTFLDSRQNFAIFVFRAHNTVNKRLDKPKQQTVADCLRTLQTNIVNTPFAGFRSLYLSYLLRNWLKEFSGDSRILAGHAREMQKINDEYWNTLDNTNDIELDEDNVLEFIEDTNIRFNATYTRILPTSAGFKGGKLRLKRN